MKLFKDFLNGLAFGAVLLVPGVSGGSIAIILGFYDNMIDAIGNFTKNIKKHTKFLAILLSGAVIGVIGFGSLISWLLARFSLPSMFFFIGLIAGIVPHIYNKVKQPNRFFNTKELLLIICPIILLVVISHVRDIPVTTPAEVVGSISASYMLLIFVAGMLGAAGMVMPGISGSFILLITGVYPVITYSVKLVLFWFADMGNIQLMLDIIKVLGPFMVGIAIGGFYAARIIGNLLKNHHKTVYLLILGLFIGSVYALFREPMVYHSGISVPIIAAGVVTLALGSAVSFALGKKKI